MIQIEIANTLQLKNEKEIIADMQKAGQVTLEYTCATDQAELSIQISTTGMIQNLNRQFLGIDAPTDVLAFPAGEQDPDTGGHYLGDVIIAYPIALSQAQASGQAVEAELVLLSVHGILHLLGYDHQDEVQKASMWQAQNKVFEQLGMEIKSP